MAGALQKNRGNRSGNRVGALVSRRLKAAGFNPLPSARRHITPGLFVSGTGSATVVIDYGNESTNMEVLRNLTAEVGTWGIGADGDFHWDRTQYGAFMVWIRFGTNA